MTERLNLDEFDFEACYKHVESLLNDGTCKNVRTPIRSYVIEHCRRMRHSSDQVEEIITVLRDMFKDHPKYKKLAEDAMVEKSFNG